MEIKFKKVAAPHSEQPLLTRKQADLFEKYCMQEGGEEGATDNFRKEESSRAAKCC